MSEGKSGEGNVDPSPAGDNIVVKLVDYAFKYLHEGLRSFFERHIDDFGEDWEVLMNEGESHEQYQIYVEYRKLMSEHLDKFSSEHGFNSFEECYEEVQRLVAEDNIKAKEEMEKVKEEMQRLEEDMLKRREESLGGAEAKRGDDDGENEGKSAEDSAKKRPKPPAFFFFKRLTLEDMLNMVLNMCEYRSFSMMMRTRAAQRR